MSFIKQFCKIALIFMVLTNTATAEFNIVNEISDGISQGFDKIIISITDQSYENMGINNTTQESIIINFMIQPNDFLSNQFVQKEKSFTAFWYAVFYVIFLLVGGIILMKDEATHSHGFGMGGHPWRNTYSLIAIIAPLVWAFYLYSFKWIFSLEYLLSKSSFLEIMDFMPPTSNNATGYAILGILRIFNILFMYIRYVTVGLIAAWFLFIIIAKFIPITEIYGTLLINYGLLMLFSRFLVVLIFLGGFGLLQASSFVSLMPESSTFALYIIPLLIALVFEITCLLYPIIYVLTQTPVQHIKMFKMR